MQTLTLTRDLSTPHGVFGYLQVGAAKFATVERPWLNNAPMVSCIPAGEYDCVVVPSNTNHAADMDYCYEALHVPGRTQICIMHVGNYPEDVNGCVAGGLSRATVGGRVMVINSVRAIKLFYSLMNKEPFRLRIVEV